MKEHVRLIIKGIIVIISIINLIFVFVFEYKLPTQTNKHNNTTSVTIGTTTENADVGKTGDSTEIAEGSSTGISNESEYSTRKCKVITDGNARIRSGPGKEYEYITSVPSQTVLTILDEENEWYYVRTDDGIQGYIFAELVEIMNDDVGKTDESTEIAEESSTGISNESEYSTRKCKVITDGNARIRSGPGKEYDHITSVPSQTILTILDEENEWYYVRTDDDIQGYIFTELVEIIIE